MDNQYKGMVVISWTQSDDLGTYRIEVPLTYLQWDQFQHQANERTDEEYLCSLVDMCWDLSHHEILLDDENRKYYEPVNITVDFY